MSSSPLYWVVEVTMRFDPRLSHAWWTLRIGLGLAPLFAGLDKYFNLLTNWEMYLNPLIPRLLHVSAPIFMHLVGVVEIVAGLLMFTRFTRYAAYIVMAWLLAIAGSLVTQGLFFDVAVRDVEISLGAFVLAKLTEVRQSALHDDSVYGEHSTSETKTAQRFAHTLKSFNENRESSHEENWFANDPGYVIARDRFRRRLEQRFNC
jgi:uncharacterized membrane protein YphA (DoxX/SURF4 family)